MKAEHEAQRGAAENDKPSGVFAESLGVRVIAAGRHAQSLFEAELALLGLTMRHLGALGHLVRNPEMSISDLARRTGVTAQSMHATVRGLETRGAVVIHDQGRGRASNLDVTDAGHALLNDARAATRRFDERVIATLDGGDVPELRRILGDFLASAPQNA